LLRRLTPALLALSLPAAAAVQDPNPAKSAIPDDKDPVTTASGLRYSVLRAGEPDGDHPAIGDRVTVHYTGWLTDGTEFDSSRRRGEPARFALGRVIPGWNEGLQLMTRGTRCKFTIPPDLGYGERGFGAVIPPKATLVFDVELIDFEKAPAFVALPAEGRSKTESGIEYVIEEAGRGEPLTAADHVELHYAVWTTVGEPVMSYFDERAPVRTAIGDLRLPFLRELLLTLREGGSCRAEVKTADAFPGSRPPALGDAATCIWMVKAAKVFAVPAFVAPDKDKLTRTDSGLQYQVLVEGSGRKPAASDRVRVHYAGWLEDGTLFDSSHGRGEPAAFELSGVIPGWTEGVQLMAEGSTYLFVIPPALAYREAGHPPKIPGNATLVFRVELIEIVR